MVGRKTNPQHWYDRNETHITSKMTLINARPENTGNFSCSVHSVTGETFTTLPGVEYIYVYGKIVFCPFFVSVQTTKNACHHDSKNFFS